MHIAQLLAGIDDIFPGRVDRLALFGRNDCLGFAAFGTGFTATGLNNQSARYVVRPSVGGDKVRIRFTNEFAAKWHTDKVLMVGDFNSYTDEDPIKAILDASQTDPGTGRAASCSSIDS